MDAVAIRGVLLDFSGTLFRLEPGAASVDGLTRSDGSPLGAERYAEILSLMTVPVGVPEHLPADLHADWHRRDLDPRVHRAGYEASLSSPALGLGEGMAARLYNVMLAPGSWRPYPDTGDALRLLRDAGVPVAVLSNIAWDIRETFAHHGLDDLVDEFVLSYTEGLVKPDPKVFELACERIGATPSDVLMIGDSAEADGAATLVGCRFERVEPQATASRPTALVDALRAHGVAG